MEYVHPFQSRFSRSVASCVSHFSPPNRSAGSHLRPTSLGPAHSLRCPPIRLGLPIHPAHPAIGPPTDSQPQRRSHHEHDDPRRRTCRVLAGAPIWQEPPFAAPLRICAANTLRLRPDPGVLTHKARGHGALVRPPAAVRPIGPSWPGLAHGLVAHGFGDSPSRTHTHTRSPTQCAGPSGVARDRLAARSPCRSSTTRPSIARCPSQSRVPRRAFCHSRFARAASVTRPLDPSHSVRWDPGQFSSPPALASPRSRSTMHIDPRARVCVCVFSVPAACSRGALCPVDIDSLWSGLCLDCRRLAVLLVHVLSRAASCGPLCRPGLVGMSRAVLCC